MFPPDVDCFLGWYRVGLEERGVYASVRADLVCACAIFFGCVFDSESAVEAMRLLASARAELKFVEDAMVDEALRSLAGTVQELYLDVFEDEREWATSTSYWEIAAVRFDWEHTSATVFYRFADRLKCYLEESARLGVLGDASTLEGPISSECNTLAHMSPSKFARRYARGASSSERDATLNAAMSRAVDVFNVTASKSVLFDRSFCVEEDWGILRQMQVYDRAALFLFDAATATLQVYRLVSGDSRVL